VGPGAKAGGPNYLIGLGSWRSQPRGKSSSTLHLRGLDIRISGLIESAQPSLDFDSFEWLRQAALSDAVAWDREFGQVRDVSQLGVERNLFRYRPVPVMVRAAADAPLASLLRVVLAGIRSGASFFVSVPEGVPAAVRAELGALEVPVAVETESEWIQRVRQRSPESAKVGRVRLIGGRGAVAQLHRTLSDAVGGDPDVAVYDNEVTSAGRLELLPFLHEQAIAITAHRFGNPDPWSTSVI
jgi:RHH-type proline utilization regulon transcriptional repressor/proline dehydrogenase/delta 1-pyrroline-5-carboxylate dehydrogenase